MTRQEAMASELARRAKVFTGSCRYWSALPTREQHHWLVEAKDFCRAIDDLCGINIDTKTWKELAE